MLKPVLRLLVICCLPLLHVGAAEAAAVPPSAAPAQGGVSRAQVQHVLSVLQDRTRLNALITTLKVLEQALPATAASPAAAKPATPAAKAAIPLAPNSLGAQLIGEASGWTGTVSRQFAGTARTVIDLPVLGTWLATNLRDPGVRSGLLGAGWRVLLVLGLAWLGEAILRRLLRRPCAAIEAHAPPNGAAAATASPRRLAARSLPLLRRLPFALARLLLDLLPVGVFLALGTALPQAGFGGSPATRAAILDLVQAYVAIRLVMCITRTLVAPASPRLRLLHMSDRAARYIETWMRRLAVVALLGGALARIGLMLGLPQAAHDALLRLVVLLVHLILVVIVVQSRRRIARFIRPPAGAAGGIALLRNWLAQTWHYFAIFIILALWVVWAAEVRNGLARLLHGVAWTVGVLVAARVLTILVMGALDRGLHANSGLAERHPGLYSRAGRYDPVLRRIFGTAIFTVVMFALLDVWGVPVLAWFGTGALGGRLVSAVLTIGITIALAVIVWEGVNAAVEQHLDRLTEQAQAVRAVRLRTLLPMLRTALLVAILLMLGLTALSEIGVNIAPLLAGAGIVGIAIGFGSQKLVQDLITGLFLLLENAMQVGDWVTAGGLSGSVEKLSIRTLWLRAGDGSVHLIPFSSVTTVTNVNRGKGNAAVNVSVALHEDTDRVGEVLQEIATGMRDEPAFRDGMLSDLQLWGVDKLDGTMATIAGQIVCTDGARWGVQREFNRRMKKRFEELGIEIAKPTQTVLLHGLPGPRGSAPPPDAAGAKPAGKAS
ncbi:MAG TPA: mechanosensitive ion channel domain-containing protein [Acetobacteraceae bacterium]|nr:mechanosensitive ion channel domain-containing protein [Acetobacteraceae bacterium]